MTDNGCGNETDRREAEQALQRSEQANRAILEAIPDLIFRVSSEGVFLDYRSGTDISPAVSPAEFLGRKMEDVLPEEISREALLCIEKTLQTGQVQVHDYQLPVPYPDGELRDFEARIAATGEEEAIVIVRDVTERKAAEEALRENAQTIRALLDASPDSGVLLDTAGTILTCNQVMEAKLGLSREEALGKCVHDFVPEDVAQGRRGACERVLRSGKAMMFEDERAGRAFENYICPVVEPDGSVSRLAIFARDVTEHRRLEQEILDVSERERQRIAEDLHDDLGQQLSGIGLMARALEEKLTAKSLPEVRDLRQILGLVSDSISKARELARGLLPAEFQDGGLTGALEALASRSEQISGVSCHFESGRATQVDSHHVATHLFRIAQEATSNSLKHGSPQNVWIRLETGSRLIALSITDDGAGIPEHSDQSGGLGLRLMRHRVSLMRGSLEIRGNSPTGTQIICTVPFPDTPS